MAELDETLLDAAYDGDLGAVKAALAAGASIDARSEYGASVLNRAVIGGSVELIDFVLEAGGSVTEPGLAVLAASDLAVLRHLLNRGASLETRTGTGETPLIRSADNTDPAVTRFLLESGVAVDETNPDGWTALTFAGYRDPRWSLVVEALLDHGADPNHQTSDGWTPLILACHNKVVATGGVQHLLSAATVDVNQRGSRFGWTPLLKAVAGQYCCDALVEQLLSLGADPNAAQRVDAGRHKAPSASVLAGNLYAEFKVSKKFDGMTSLMWALQKKRTKAAAMLCEAGADVHATTSAGATVESFAKSKAAKAMLAKYA